MPVISHPSVQVFIKVGIYVIELPIPRHYKKCEQYEHKINFTNLSSINMWQLKETTYRDRVAASARHRKTTRRSSSDRVETMFYHRSGYVWGTRKVWSEVVGYWAVVAPEGSSSALDRLRPILRNRTETPFGKEISRARHSFGLRWMLVAVTLSKSSSICVRDEMEGELVDDNCLSSTVVDARTAISHHAARTQTSERSSLP